MQGAEAPRLDLALASTASLLLESRLAPMGLALGGIALALLDLWKHFRRA